MQSVHPIVNKLIQEYPQFSESYSIYEQTLGVYHQTKNVINQPQQIILVGANTENMEVSCSEYGATQIFARE